MRCISVGRHHLVRVVACGAGEGSSDVLNATVFHDTPATWCSADSWKLDRLLVPSFAILDGSDFLDELVDLLLRETECVRIEQRRTISAKCLECVVDGASELAEAIDQVRDQPCVNLVHPSTLQALTAGAPSKDKSAGVRFDHASGKGLAGAEASVTRLP